MKRIALLGLLACLITPALVRAQITDATVCEILANPRSFDGKMVRVKGVVIAGFEEFSVKDADCSQPVNSIWLSYPTGTKAKSGPAAFLRLQLAKNSPASVSAVTRVPVNVEKNKNFKDFDKSLSTPAKTSAMCMGCMKYTVTAILIGRLDGSSEVGLIRDSSGTVTGLGGFGNLNRYQARLVLRSVSDVVAQEIDYSKTVAAPPDAAAASNRSFIPGPPTADQVKRAADAFGAEGEHNGVGVGFGGANEVPSNDGAKSNSESPDGISFDATFDSDQLKGPAMQLAISHVGTHIADIRAPQNEVFNVVLYGAEFHAWQTTILSAIGAKTKTLILPGGYPIYDQSWSTTDMGKNAYAGISGFLTKWSGISNPPKL